MPAPSEILRRLATEGLLRTLRPLDSAAGPRVARGGRELWNFASNDYLGLARHPEVEAAMIEGVHRFGAGSAASRLVSGTLPPHLALENHLAAAKQTEAALVFSSGFATALGTIPAIVGKDGFVFLDKLCHASLVDAARLSGATIRVFPHNDTGKLARLLVSTRAKFPAATILVATESVFSMDGDLCPLAAIVDLVDSASALLLVDEAHGIGTRGPTGMGLAEELGLQRRIAFQMGTLSKAAGLSGGYIAASREWIEVLVNRARSFVFSTAPPPSIAHAAIKALEIIASTEGTALRERLRGNISALRPHPSPIIPIILGTSEAALAASSRLDEAGFLVPAIRFPTVARGTARLRISLSAAHPPEVVRALATAIQSLPSHHPVPNSPLQ